MERLTREIEGQSDAGWMRFGREVIPDTQQIVRSAVDERFNAVFTKLQSSDRRLEEVAELVQERVTHRGQRATEDKVNMTPLRNEFPC